LGVPELSLPDVEAPLPEAPTESEVPASVPVDANAILPEVSQRTADDLPESDRELVGERDAVTEVWENTDGTQTVKIHGEPVHYQPGGSSGWEEVDNSLVAVPGRSGWVQNAANDWIVRFGPVGPGGAGGVEMVTDAGPLRFAPVLDAGSSAVALEVGTGDDADTVTYQDVWPGVDVVYTVSGGAVHEDLVVEAAGRSSFPFVVEGLGLEDTTGSGETPTLEVTGALADMVEVLSPEVTGSDGRGADGDAEPDYTVAAAPTSGGGAVVDSPAVPGGPQALVVSVEEEWLSEEIGSGDGPVVIDPTVTITNSIHSSYKDDSTVFNQDGIRVGNSQGGAGGGDSFWRGAAAFPYWSSISGKQVLYAGIQMTRVDGSTSGQPVYGWEACSGDYSGSTCNNNGAKKYATVTGFTTGTVELDVTNLVKKWRSDGVQNGTFGFSGAETASAFTYKKFGTPTLVLNVNTAPNVPGLVAPGNDSLAIVTNTSTLKWNTVTDPDGDAVTYTAKVSTGTDGESGLVASGPSGTATAWQVPAGVLRDGVTYYWAVWASDGNAWTKSTVRRFTVDHQGISPPTDGFGGVGTNLVTGRGSLTVPGVALPTTGGEIGVSFTYDTQAPAGGLRGTYRIDEDTDNVIDTSDDVVLTRDDSQISFNWAGSTTASEASSPSPGVPNEHFSAVWEGSIAVPSGTWKLGVRSDDGVRVFVDGSSTPVINDWATGTMGATPDYQTGTVGTGVHDIKIEYFQDTGAAGIELWAKNTAPDPDVEVVVPAGWLSAAPRALPVGWRLDAGDTAEYTRAEISEGSVTLFRSDGTAVAFPKTALGFGYAPPKGIEDVVVPNSDGTVTVQADSGRTYLFNQDGSAAGWTSPLDEDPALSTAAVPHYNSAGRLDEMTDPVSEQDITLHYAPDSACEEDPPIIGGGDFGPIPTGMLCRIDYWDGTATRLYYKNGLLGYVRNPGDAYWGLSYDSSGKLIGYHDPVAFDAAYSGARSDWTELLVNVGYDSSGRITTLTQPSPLQGDPRPAMTYAYSPTVNGNGELASGTATVTRAGVSGTYRSAGYDARGRTTTETDAAGLTTTTTWNGDDQVVRTDQPGGLRSTTFYNQESQPTDEYGPAPASDFNSSDVGNGDVPHETTEFDGGIDGLAVQWWPNLTFAGLPAVHEHDPGSLDSNWGTASPAAGIPADNFVGRYTGEILFTAAGTYTLRLERDSKLNLYLDDTIRSFEWFNTTTGFSPEIPVTVAAGESHRVRIDFGDTTGSAKLNLQWKTPGSSTWVTVPAGALRTGYGLVTSATDATGNQTDVDYTDSASALDIVDGTPTAAVTDPSGLAITNATRYETAGHRRPVATIMPSGDERTLTYYGDTESRDNPCTSASDPANQAGRQKLDTATDPDGAGTVAAIVNEVVYDATGRPVATRVGAESWTCTTYDARGRPVKVEHPASGGSAARTVDYDYTVDPDGSGPVGDSPLLGTVTDPVGTVTIESNLLGQTISQTDVFGNTTETTVDQASRPTTTVGPAGTIVSTYNAADRVTAIERNSLVVASTFVYDSAGRLTGVTYPSGTGNAGNGTAGTFGYDPLGRASSVTWTGPSSTTITSDVVTRDKSARIVDQTIDGTDPRAGTNNNFTYDAAGRLTDAWIPGARYQYSFFENTLCSATGIQKNANRTQMAVTPTGGSATTTTYCYDHADRLTTTTDSSTGTITYDAHGNTTGIFGETHTYDSANRHLTTTKSTTTVTYVRDALDRIVERKVNGSTTARYGYSDSSDSPSFTTNTSNAVQDTSLGLPGGTILTIRAAGNIWSYPNIHGDMSANANQSGVKQGSTITYDPFGNTATSGLPDNLTGNTDNGWLGSHKRLTEHEPTLQPILELGARQYSPLLGRFLETDPVNGGSANSYDYGNADPCNSVDLDGAWPSPPTRPCQGAKYKGAAGTLSVQINRQAAILLWSFKISLEHRPAFSLIATVTGRVVANGKVKSGYGPKVVHNWPTYTFHSRAPGIRRGMLVTVELWGTGRGPNSIGSLHHRFSCLS
jgi:RHS repeat-associated protein